MSDSVLLLRLAGPLQAWGVPSPFNRRDTAAEPSKSGVVGLLASALGRPREESVADLAALRMGVRSDQPGTLLRDYHTTADYRGFALPAAATNKKGVQKRTSPKKYTYVTQRYYLQDAVFVVGLQGDAELLRTLHTALRQPRFPLFLGRRSCPPARPVVIGWSEHTDLRAALRAHHWEASPHVQEKHRSTAAEYEQVTLSVCVDDPVGGHMLRDHPLTFHPKNRALGERRVSRDVITIATHLAPLENDQEKRVSHDPFALLGW